MTEQLQSVPIDSGSLQREYFFTPRELLVVSRLMGAPVLATFQNKLQGLTNEALVAQRQEQLGRALAFRDAYEDPDYGSNDYLDPQEAKIRMLISLAHLLLINRVLEVRSK